jgi:hypothetical protein
MATMKIKNVHASSIVSHLVKAVIGATTLALTPLAQMTFALAALLKMFQPLY